MSKPLVRWLALILITGGLAGAAVIARLPTRAECRAMGGTVDPTERHCVEGDGYVQLQEHVTGHAIEAVVIGSAAVLLAFGLRALVRSRKQTA
jgi:hypothetical protein